MNLRRNLLWVDGIAGAVVGIFVLSLSSWLPEFYQLPKSLVLLMGAANLVYASYSLTLARRSRRPMAFIWLLVAANLTWAVFCVRWGVLHGETASFFGLVQLWGEAIFVGGLAGLEWRWRELLATD